MHVTVETAAVRSGPRLLNCRGPAIGVIQSEIDAGEPMYAITEHVARTQRHTTFYLACGAVDATPLIFVHGWPELSISWRHQLPIFAALGFRCVAPDMRGYGRSGIYPRHEDYALEHT